MSPETLWKSNRGIAYKIGNEFLYIPGFTREDVYQEALIALLRAARTFDPDRGYKFSTHAYTVVRRHLIDVLDRENNGRRRAMIGALSLTVAHDEADDDEHSWDAAPQSAEDYEAVQRGDVTSASVEARESFRRVLDLLGCTLTELEHRAAMVFLSGTPVLDRQLAAAAVRAKRKLAIACG